MTMEPVRAAVLVFFEDWMLKDQTIDAADGNGRSCLVKLKRYTQTPGYIGVSCESVVKSVLARPEDWAAKYAALRQQEGDRYEVRTGEYHDRRVLFMLMAGVPDTVDAVETVVRKVDHFLYVLRGLDDFTREWQERFGFPGYPTPDQVYDWLRPSGSVYT